MNINERVAVLEAEQRQDRQDIQDLQSKVSYYDKMAMRWGGAMIALLVVGSIIGGHFDKLREKVLEWFL